MADGNQTDEQFNAQLESSIEQIYQAFGTQAAPQTRGPAEQSRQTRFDAAGAAVYGGGRNCLARAEQPDLLDIHDHGVPGTGRAD